MKPEDFLREPCRCPPCQQAGVSDRQQVRDRTSGAWLHGYELKRWWQARDKFWDEWDAFRKKLNGKDMR